MSRKSRHCYILFKNFIVNLCTNVFIFKINSRCFVLKDVLEIIKKACEKQKSLFFLYIDLNRITK